MNRSRCSICHFDIMILNIKYFNTKYAQQKRRNFSVFLPSNEDTQRQKYYTIGESFDAIKMDVKDQPMSKKVFQSHFFCIPFLNIRNSRCLAMNASIISQNREESSIYYFILRSYNFEVFTTCRFIIISITPITCKSADGVRYSWLRGVYIDLRCRNVL